MTAPLLSVHEVQLFERPTQFRIPFRFGANTVREAPQAFVRVRIGLDDGREAWGSTAELMVPKWFDKNPALSNEDNFAQLRRSLQRATDAYSDERPQTAFALSAAHYDALVIDPDSGLNPLTAAFGPAQLDKAIMDALCRALMISFATALQSNVAALTTEPLAPDLDGFDIDALLLGLSMPHSIHARHTVGLADPLSAADARTAGPLEDGLPETLEEVITRYGHRYFKIKISGALDEDLRRLSALAALLGTHCPDYRLTLDGNERYSDVEGITTLWETLSADAQFKTLLQRVLYIEQPIERKHALTESVQLLADRIPVIIDESDGIVDTYPRARELGYTGISSKTCKGFYKSLLNAARSRLWNRNAGTPRYFLSGEDLTCQAGLAVQQDLALVGALGLEHVERNGHHYVNGMAGADSGEQERFSSNHAGLYTHVHGRTCLDIEAGRIQLDSLNCIGFASAAEPSWESMRELSWEQQSHG